MKRKASQRSQQQIYDDPEITIKKPKLANSAASPEDVNQRPNATTAPEELPPTVTLAREMVEHLAQYVTNAAFKYLPQDLQLLVTQSQDLAKAIVNKPRAGLMTLPVELRLQIYRYFLVEPDLICCTDFPSRIKNENHSDSEEDEEYGIFTEARQRTREGRLPRRGGSRRGTRGRKSNDDRILDKPNTHPLLLVSKTVSQEALDVLYGEHTFEMDLYSHPFSLANLRRIKKPRIQLRKKDLPYLPQAPASTWENLFHGVAAIDIEITVERERPRAYNEEHRDYWAVTNVGIGWECWCRAWIEALSRVIEADTLVRIVDAHADEVNAILQEYIPNHILVGEIGPKHILAQKLSGGD